jgi:intracellular septation protein
VGGLIPIALFTLIEELYGTLAGLVAAMVFGLGEILYEWRTRGKVEALTWGGNGLILVLGALSLWTSEGVWFKLQPALIEGVIALALWISQWRGAPLLLVMARKQGTFPENLPPELTGLIERNMRGMNFRIGLFFAAHCALAVWAGLRWSTAAWALLKGVGLTVSLMLYLVVETLVLRYRFAKWKSSQNQPRAT